MKKGETEKKKQKYRQPILIRMDKHNQDGYEHEASQEGKTHPRCKFPADGADDCRCPQPDSYDQYGTTGNRAAHPAKRRYEVQMDPLHHKVTRLVFYNQDAGGAFPSGDSPKYRLTEICARARTRNNHLD